VAPRSEFTNYVLDQLAPLGPIAVRRMFGGAGVFLDGRMFALLADDMLYLKADDLTRPEFETAGMARFTYETKGRPKSMSYYGVSEDMLDDAETLCVWARKAVEAALRAQAGKKTEARSRR